MNADDIQQVSTFTSHNILIYKSLKYEYDVTHLLGEDSVHTFHKALSSMARIRGQNLS